MVEFPDYGRCPNCGRVASNKGLGLELDRIKENKAHYRCSNCPFFKDYDNPEDVPQSE
jgi:rubredoxin